MDKQPQPTIADELIQQQAIEIAYLMLENKKLNRELQELKQEVETDKED